MRKLFLAFIPFVFIFFLKSCKTRTKRFKANTTIYHPTGTKHLVGNIINNTWVDSVFVYYPNEILHQKQYYKDSKLVKVKNYTNEGLLSYEEEQESSTILANRKEYKANGNLLFSYTPLLIKGEVGNTPHYSRYRKKKGVYFEFFKDIDKIKIIGFSEAYKIEKHLPWIKWDLKLKKWIITYKDSAQKAEYFIGEYNTNTHLPDGTWKWLNKNKKPIVSIGFKNGKLHGAFVFYNSQGKIKTQLHYKENILNGDIAIYTKKGTLITEGNYLNGKKNGNWKIYTENGNLLEDRIFNKGKRDKKQTYYYKDSEQLKSIVFWNNENREMHKDKVWYKNGTLKQEGKEKKYYPNGQLQLHSIDETNLYREYYSNGKLKEFRCFPVRILYTDSGTVQSAFYKKSYGKSYESHNRSEKQYLKDENKKINSFPEEFNWMANKHILFKEHKTLDSNNKENGLYAINYPNGNKFIEMNFKNGFLHGKVTHFTIKGDTIKALQFYENQFDGKQIYYSVNRTILKTTQYKKGIPYGVLKEYSFIDGTLSSIYNFDTKSRKRYAFGKLNNEQKYISDNQYYEKNYFQKTEDVKSEIWYSKENIKHGFFFEINNKKIKTEGYYLNGKKHGVFIYTYPNGDIKKEEYILGNLLP